MTTESRLVVPVTPAGWSPTVWAPLVAAAPVIAAADMAASVGGQRPTLLLLGAHPDDETIGCGRLASWWGRHVGAVVAVVATAGEACLDHVRDRPAGLAERRLREWRAALAELGAEAYACLHLPDGAVAASTPDLKDGVAVVLDQLATSGPVLFAAPWQHDPHPDHAACGAVAAQLAADRGLPLVQYPVWMTYWSDPEAGTAPRHTLRRVPTDVAADVAHRRACACFASQLEPAGPGLGAVVPDSMLAHHDQQLLIMDGAWS